MRLVLLTDAELLKIVESDDASLPEYFKETMQTMKVMAMEILEYRRAYGPLGCEWLEY